MHPRKWLATAAGKAVNLVYFGEIRIVVAKVCPPMSSILLLYNVNTEEQEQA